MKIDLSFKLRSLLACFLVFVITACSLNIGSQLVTSKEGTTSQVLDAKPTVSPDISMPSSTIPAESPNDDADTQPATDDSLSTPTLVGL